MARIDIDLSTATDPREPAPAGTYRMQVQEAEITESKAGNPMLVVASQIIGDDEAAGKWVRDYCVLSNNGGKFRARQYAEAAGADLTGLDTEDLVDMEFDAELVIESDEEYGDQNRINRILLDG